jgi:flagellar basal body rod protein FlgG
MFRFTIRDVLWLTVVVGMGVGWMVNRRAEPAFIFTGNQFHLAIDGDGYFAVEDRNSASVVFSRRGEFRVNEYGELVLSLEGRDWPISPCIQVPSGAKLLVVEPDGDVFWREPAGQNADQNFIAIGKLQIALFDQPDKLHPIATAVYAMKDITSTWNVTSPGQRGAGLVRQGVLERPSKRY